MSVATWIQHELEQSGVAFEETHHDEVYTSQRLAQREHMSGHRVAKVVIVIADGRPVELIMPASRRVLLAQVRSLLEAKNLRLATEEELQQYFTDCELGAIPALRHWKDVDILMDTSLRTDGDILIQAGTHRDAVRLRFDDWFRMVNPREENFTEPERSSMSGKTFGAEDSEGI
jgi:Ala-tRNA(Pro) deacylase